MCQKDDHDETKVQDRTFYPQLLMLGDSITQSATMTLQAWLQTLYIRRMDIINRGFSGHTSLDGVSLLPRIMPPFSKSLYPQVKLMTLWFGANDASGTAECLDKPQVSLDRFRDSLKGIITHPDILAHGTKIILFTQPPIDEHQRPDNRLPAKRALAYAKVVRELSQEYKLPLVDTWSIFMKKAGWTDDTDSSEGFLPGEKTLPPNQVLKELLIDGLHLTIDGYRTLYPELIEVIKKEIPDLSPENFALTIAKGQPGWEWEELATVDQLTQEPYPTSPQDLERQKKLWQECQKYFIAAEKKAD